MAPPSRPATKTAVPSLAMTHLEDEPDIDDLRGEATGTAEQPSTEEADPRDSPEYAFDFDFTDARGTRFTGKFTNKILDVGGIIAVGKLRAKLGNYAPVISLDSGTQYMIGMIAHMTISLSQVPTWAKDLRRVLNPRVLELLYEKVQGHETRFFRLEADPSANPPTE